jgi:hypothetical protein
MIILLYILQLYATLNIIVLLLSCTAVICSLFVQIVLGFIYISARFILNVYANRIYFMFYIM